MDSRAVTHRQEAKQTAVQRPGKVIISMVSYARALRSLVPNKKLSKRSSCILEQCVSSLSVDDNDGSEEVSFADEEQEVVEVSTFETGGYANCHFVAIDIFTWERFESTVSSSHNCYVPHVNRTDYQLIDISKDGHLRLLTENGNTKDDLVLPTDKWLRDQIKDGFNNKKDLVLSVMSAMGEEQICALKYVGPKN